MKDEKKSAVDPRILRTRQLIRGAFVELLQEMDIEKLSVNKIAERATINRVTFYLHYRDITDMMEKMADEMIEHIERIVDEYALILRSIGRKRLGLFWSSYWSILQRTPRFIRSYLLQSAHRFLPNDCSNC